MAENPDESSSILQNAGYVLLSPDRLVFVAAEGKSFSTLRDFLVIVDLSTGIARPVIKTVDIPKAQLQRTGENPAFVKVDGIEPNDKDSVKLLLPPGEYGSSSIVVALPQ